MDYKCNIVKRSGLRRRQAQVQDLGTTVGTGFERGRLQGPRRRGDPQGEADHDRDGDRGGRVAIQAETGDPRFQPRAVASPHPHPSGVAGVRSAFSRASA